MAPCEDRPDQVVELGVDTEREGENTVGPLEEEDWERRMKARREAESERAREAVQAALQQLTALLSAQSAVRQKTGRRRRRAVVLQVERGGAARQQLRWWLDAARLAGLQSPGLHTDIVLFTDPGSVTQLPSQCRAVREDVGQAGPCLFRALPASSQSLRHILAGPESAFLLRYDSLLRAELHSLPTPALQHLQHLQPDQVLVSTTSSSSSSTARLASVEAALERTALAGGLQHQGWHHLGSSVLAPPAALRLLARLSLALERLSQAEMFGAGGACRCSSCSQLPRQCQRGRGPYPGHLASYAENIALNALLTESQYLASLRHFQQGNSSQPHLNICSLALLDTREDREAGAVLESQGRFRDFNLTQLELSTARGWSLYTALTSSHQGLGAPQSAPADLCSSVENNL